MEPEKGKNRMQEAMEKVPAASQLEIVKTAHKHRIDENEPAWVLVELAMEAVGGVETIAQSLREASAKVTEATRDEVKASRDKAKDEIEKMQEKAKGNVAAALAGTLETEIRNAVVRLQSQSNRPLHKNWLIAMGMGLVIAGLVGGWGMWSFYKYAKNVGEAEMSSFMGSPDFQNLMKCDLPGWKKQWVGAEKEKKLGCYPYPDKKSGRFSGWQIP